MENNMTPAILTLITFGSAIILAFVLEPFLAKVSKTPKTIKSSKTVTREEFDDAIKTINCYHRKVTGKKECIGFYVDHVQPIVILINELDGHKEDI